MGTIVHAVLVTVLGNVLRGEVEVEVLRIAAGGKALKEAGEERGFPAPRPEVGRLTLC